MILKLFFVVPGMEMLKSNDQSLMNKLNLGSEYIKHNFQPSNRAKAYLEIINKYE